MSSKSSSNFSKGYLEKLENLLGTITPFAFRQDREIYNGFVFEAISKHLNTNARVYKVSCKGEPDLCIKIERSKTMKVLAEFEYLSSLRKSFLPEVYFCGGVLEMGYYVMEFLSGFETFSHRYTENITSWNDVKSVLLDLDSLVIETSKDMKRECEELYAKRLHERLQLLRGTFLVDTLKYPKITINGKELDNLLHFWEKFNEVSEYPTMGVWGAFPGDAHFENILYKKPGTYKIIDPKGRNLMPLEYDYGKLLHSFHGQYDYIKQGKFFKKELRKGVYRFEINVLDSSLLGSFREFVTERRGQNVLRNSFFSEIVHFSSLIAHHASNRDETIGLYLQTLVLIDEFKEKFLSKRL